MSSSSLHISFCTFAMLIIDEIVWNTPNPPPTQHDLIGGAGTYAALGARLAVSPSRDLTRAISWIVDIGSDFPRHLKSVIEKWNTSCIFREDLTRLTTRAWNGYGMDGFREFKYITPKRRLEASSLNDDQAMSQSFHMVCAPARCTEIVQNLLKKRAEIDSSSAVPIIVWEPVPDKCSPDELQGLHRAANDCTIVSPNHLELRLFFENTDGIDQDVLIQKFMGWNVNRCSDSTDSATIPIVREGSNGSTAYFRVTNAAVPSTSNITDPAANRQCIIPLHLTAYHDLSMASLVVDATGGGNTYLGALAISMTDIHSKPMHRSLEFIYRSLGWCRNLDSFEAEQIEDVPNAKVVSFSLVRRVLVAMIIANIAASFAIEQHGTPRLANASDQVEDETWNGDTFLIRLSRYLERESFYICEQLQSIKSLLGV